jgi:adenylosuccinate lyase
MGFLANDKIMAVVSLYQGKTEQQICDELGITIPVFTKWREEYDEISSKFNWLMNENGRLRKMFTDLSLIISC